MATGEQTTKVKVEMVTPKTTILLEDADYAMYQTLKELTNAIKTLTGAIRSG